MRLNSMVLLIALFTIQSAHAFCVYNKTDIGIKVYQVKGGRKFKKFRAKLGPGQKACCHWSNRDCNKSGKRDADVSFQVFKDKIPREDICFEVYVKAGGWLVVKGKNGHYFCETGF